MHQSGTTYSSESQGYVYRNEEPDCLVTSLIEEVDLVGDDFNEIVNLVTVLVDLVGKVFDIIDAVFQRLGRIELALIVAGNVEVVFNYFCILATSLRGPIVAFPDMQQKLYFG